VLLLLLLMLLLLQRPMALWGGYTVLAKSACGAPIFIFAIPAFNDNGCSCACVFDRSQTVCVRVPVRA
jgi:hypothetical protein